MNIQKIAAIDIGSSSIRMTIAELVDGDVRILEELRHSVKLGNDSFNKGRISRSTINDCISVLVNFRKICDEYGVNKIKSVATTAVREAVNADIFIDNVKTRTDIDVEILSSIKETEFIFKALNLYVTRSKNYSTSGDNGMIVEIGAGTIEITFINKDLILYTSSMPVGVLKLKQIFGKYPARDVSFDEFITSTIGNELRSLKKDFKNLKIDTLYGIGSEIDCLLKLFKKENTASDKINEKDLEKLYRKISGYNENEIIHELNIPYDLSDTFLPAVIIFKSIIDTFKCYDIHIPPVTLRDGIIGEYTIRENAKKYYSNLENQIRENSLSIGRSLNFDENHATCISEFSLKIFDATRSLHDLGNMERCYLIAASILHDIGVSISGRSHHKHSLYIINSRDFFYFNDNDRNIVANIARYHRRSAPKDTHVEYMRLCHKDRMTVLKLASILRLGDSLDNSNLQLIDGIKAKIENGNLEIRAETTHETFAEIYSFNFKKELFEELFGITVELKIEGKKNEK